MLSVVMLSGVMLSVVMLTVVMLTVVMLTVVMLSGALCCCHYAECSILFMTMLMPLCSVLLC